MTKKIFVLKSLFLFGIFSAQSDLVSTNSKFSADNPKVDNISSIPENQLVADPQSLLIASTGSLTVGTGGLLTLTNSATNLGVANNFTLENDGNLIQINGTANTGNLLAKRNVTGIHNIPGVAVDYIYWSAPVFGQQTKGAGGFSPGTPNNNFFSYGEWNDRFFETSDVTFVPGKGYAVRAENGRGEIYDRGFEFRGVPNNGDISIPIKRSPNTGAQNNIIHGYNLVGNPYPSNIKFDVLYDGNAALIYKSIWFWTNATFTQYQQGANYNGNNYAVYNGTGGNAATRASAVPAATVKPNGIVKVGQGFIIQKRDFGSGNLLFKNSYGTDQDLRVNTAGTFFSRDAQPKNRFTLQLTAPDNLVNSALIGYIPGATDQYEKDYDAEAFTVSANLLYSVLDNRRLLIQGKSNDFSTKDKVDLGINFYQNGTYTINLDEAEGIFENGQKVYLNDKQTRTITDLTTGSYSFTSDSGENNSRFQIIYEPESVLATDDLSKEQIVVYHQNGDFVIKSPKEMNRIEIYEPSGKLIQILKPNAKLLVIQASTLINGMYILKIQTVDGAVVSKKIVR